MTAVQTSDQVARSDASLTGHTSEGGTFMNAHEDSRRFQVIVIGAGQAGLAMGYFLTQQGRRFVILDTASSIGAAWRARWDSLTLFTPRRYDSLPGLEFPGYTDGYPTRDEVIEYLERYAETLKLPVALGNGVQSLAITDDGFVLELEDGSSIEADQVVVAKRGRFRSPASLRSPLTWPRRSSRRTASATEIPRPPRRKSPHRRRRQYGLPNRSGARGDARGSPRRRLAPDPASPAVPRPRSLLVARENRGAPQDRRFPARSAHARSRHADRLEPALS